MLTSTLSSTTTTGTASIGVLSITAPVGIPEYGFLVIVVLILLLSVKETLSASKKWSKALECTLNMTIIPLVVTFVAIILFKLSEMI